MSTTIYEIYKYEGDPAALISVLNQARIELKNCLIERALEVINEGFGYFYSVQKEELDTAKKLSQEQWAIFAYRSLCKDVRKQKSMSLYYDTSYFSEYLCDFLNSIVIYQDGKDIYLHLFGSTWGIRNMRELLRLEENNEICWDNRTDDKRCNIPESVQLIKRLIPNGRPCDHGISVIMSDEVPNIFYRWEDDEIRDKLTHSIDPYFSDAEESSHG